jgi:predicted PurR-regulated permease PerM
MRDRTQDATDPPIQETEERSDWTFIRRLMLTVLVGVGSLVAWRLADVLVLAFASVLLALVLRGLAGLLSRRTRLPEAWMVAPVVLVIVAMVGAVGWLFGSQISGQFDSLAKVLPTGARQLTQDFSNVPWIAWLLNQAQGIDLSSVISQAAGSIRAVFTSAFRGIAYSALLIFAGIYLAVQPARYREGFLLLMPGKRRARIGAVLDLAGETLKRWMVGQLITMVIVGALTGFGLWALGIGAPRKFAINRCVQSRNKITAGTMGIRICARALQSLANGVRRRAESVINLQLKILSTRHIHVFIPAHISLPELACMPQRYLDP